MERINRCPEEIVEALSSLVEIKPEDEPGLINALCWLHAVANNPCNNKSFRVFYRTLEDLVDPNS